MGYQQINKLIDQLQCQQHKLEIPCIRPIFLGLCKRIWPDMVYSGYYELSPSQQIHYGYLKDPV